MTLYQGIWPLNTGRVFYFSRPLTDDGSSSGSFAANVDGSVTPVRFYISPVAGVQYVLKSMRMVIQGRGTFDSDVYGDLATALATGVQVGMFDDAGVLQRPFSFFPIQSNLAWSQFAITNFQSWGGQQDKHFEVIWRFDEEAGVMVDISKRDKGYSFGVQINDDLSGLTSHVFMAQGQLRELHGGKG